MGIYHPDNPTTCRKGLQGRRCGCDECDYMSLSPRPARDRERGVGVPTQADGDMSTSPERRGR